jgi:glycerophosphoryl diester phosphodiesterase
MPSAARSEMPNGATPNAPRSDLEGAVVNLRLPQVIGHRGAAAAAPENTLESFREAAAEGARWVEFDAKLSAEGQVFLLHDDDLDRTTNGKGAARLKTLMELKQLDAGGWFAPGFAGAKLPTLAETVALLSTLDLNCNIEIKPCPGRDIETAEVVMAELRRIWPAGREKPLISSFALDSLRTARAAAPEFPRGILLDGHPIDWLAQARGVASVSVNIGDEYATPQWIEEIKQADYGLLVYTVNDPERAAQLIGWGADGVFSDTPGRILAGLAKTL